MSAILIATLHDPKRGLWSEAMTQEGAEGGDCGQSQGNKTSAETLGSGEASQHSVALRQLSSEVADSSCHDYS
jgi:hypothetical protein